MEIRDLHVALAGVGVLSGVDLELGPTEVLALLGPSGCGKTTLLRAIAGFVTPGRGCIAIHDQRVAGKGVWIEPQHRNVGLVPQEGALFPHLTVAGNVGFGLESSPRQRRGERVAECLELVGLAGMGSRRPAELSGGQQQRVALARALAPGPSVVLLDEPFSALDATLRQQLREEVRSVLHTAGVAAVLVTHDQQEALSFAERVAVMEHGRIAQIATPETLYRHPATLGVGAFVGESSLLEGSLLHHPGGDLYATCTFGTVEVTLPDAVEGERLGADGDAVVLLVRPEQVELSSPAGGGRSSDEPLATVASTTYFGHDGLVRLELDGGQVLLSRVHRARLPEPGARLAVSVTGSVAAFPE